MKDIFDGNCEIVLDLLPLYADNCTSEAASKAIHAHLLNCDECRNHLNSIKKSKKNVFCGKIPETSPNFSEILTKVKHRKTAKHTAVSVLIVALLAGNVILALTHGE